jgi:CheY-like chemotaxis protein
MGRIFISAAHGGKEAGGFDPGAVVGGTTEADEMKLTRDLLVKVLKERGYPVLTVPDGLSALQSIDWINSRAVGTDVALEIHANAFTNPVVRGTSVFYIANNQQRRLQGMLLVQAMQRRVPELPSRGVRSDSVTGLGKLAFCRQVSPASLLMEVIALTNLNDRELLQTRRQQIVEGLADGLDAWSRLIAGAGPSYDRINIRINNQLDAAKGILVNGNSYIPQEVLDRLGISLKSAPNIPQVSVQSQVYARAVDFRTLNLGVDWNATTRTLLLVRNLPANINRLDATGQTSLTNLQTFLAKFNPKAAQSYPNLASLYLQEAKAEGINHDLAFAQMCLETNYLTFGNTLQPWQNNYGGLSTELNELRGAAFADSETGVRAHIQTLKAYANREPLNQPLVAPRFRFIPRGSGMTVEAFGPEWNPQQEPNYGDKVKAMMVRLYNTLLFNPGDWGR